MGKHSIHSSGGHFDFPVALVTAPQREMTSSARVNEGTLRNAGSSLGSPAHQYGLTCEDHDHERDAVVEERLGCGDEQPDDQGVQLVGAVGEPAERDENLPTEQSVDDTWNEMPRYLQPLWKRRPLESHHGTPLGQSSSPCCLQIKAENKIFKVVAT